MYAELIDRKGPVSITVFWIGISCLFLVFCGALYYPAISGGWFLDDFPNIVLNDSIKNFSVSLQNAFTRRGVSFLSFAVDFSLWGLDPHLSRMVNIVIHLCNSLLVVALCLEIAGRKRTGIAVVVGMVFLCHPLQTSAVNYVVQRMSLLSALFALCSLLLLCRYFKATETGAKTQQILMLCCAVFAGMLSVLSKENTVLIICLVPFVACVIGKGHMRGGWLFATVVYTVVPLVAVIAHFLAVDSILGGVGGAVFYQDTGAPFYSKLANHDYLPVRYLLSQGEVLWVYLKLVFFPFEQALDYCWPIPNLEFRPMSVFTFALIAGAWAAVFRKRKQYPLSFFGFHWVLFFTAVESSIIPLDPIFEHRLYLLMVGICLIVVEQTTTRITNQKILTIVALTMLVFYSSLCWNRNTMWGGNEVDFWKSNNSVAERAPRPEGWLGVAYFKNKEFAAAAKTFRPILSWEEPGGLRLTGEALYFAGKENEAFELFAQLGTRFPGENSLEVFSAYAASKKEQWGLMEELLKKGQSKDYDDVRIPWLRATIAEEQQDNLNAAIYAQEVITAWEKKAILDPARLSAIGYVEWARDLREQALSLLSDWLAEQGRLIIENHADAKLKSEFGGRLLQLGLHDQAREQYESAARLAPSAWSLYYNLGIVSKKLHDLKSSLDYYEKALALSPGNTLVLENLAAMALEQKRYRKAESLYREITVNAPLNGKVWLALGNVQESMNKTSEAKLSYDRAALLPGYSWQAELNLKRLASKSSGSL